jgi:hypothetical protein
VDTGFGSTPRVTKPDDRNADDALEIERRGTALQMLATTRRRRELLELEELSNVSRARAAGAKWTEIGVALRVSERVVSKKYGPLLKPQVPNGPVTRNGNESKAF